MLVKLSTAMKQTACRTNTIPHYHYGVNQAISVLARLLNGAGIEKASLGILSSVGTGLGLPAIIFPTQGNRTAKLQHIKIQQHRSGCFSENPG